MRLELQRFSGSRKAAKIRMRRPTNRAVYNGSCINERAWGPRMVDRMKKDTKKNTVGLDVGDKYTHFCELDAGAELVDEGRFRTTRIGLQRRFDKVESMLVILETGTHSRWMAEYLESLGHEVLVANARELRLIYANKFKDDRLDAERLARLSERRARNGT